jgi:aconitate hydratase
MSPPLVVAYALAGRMDIDLVTEPLGRDPDGEPVYLRDLWPSAAEIDEVIAASIDGEMFQSAYADVFAGDDTWRSLDGGDDARFQWDPLSTYARRPPHLEGLEREPAPVEDIVGARCLALLGDSITTDHLSPAGLIRPDSPAGRYLAGLEVERGSFNTYATRRGNHEVMMRAAFANVRLKNELAPNRDGPWTTHLPSGEELTIFDAARRYREDGVPTIVVAGSGYGNGSSRDWAAKGPKLLGVRAILAETLERIHRSNLLMMGVLPLEFLPGENRHTLGLTGHETFSITGLDGGAAETVTIVAGEQAFRARVRLDTPREREYVRHGGILPYVLRSLLARTG